MLQDSRSDDMELLILGGNPIREPIAWHGPFVMNTKQELMGAFEDYRNGKLGIIPAENYTSHNQNEERTTETD